MKAIILAAGFGTRLNPLTNNLPKPMLTIANKPIIQHNIEWLRKNSIKDIAVNLHHLPEKIKNFLGDGSKFNVHITYSYEKDILGTAGGVKNLEHFAKGSAFLVYYGDNITNLDVKKLINFHHEKKGIAAICLHKIKEDELKDSSIVELAKDSRILRFIEKPDAPTIKRLIKKQKSRNHFYSNAGIYILEPSILKSIPKGKFSDFAKDVFPKLIKEGKKIYGYPLKGCFWAELGTLEKYNKIKDEMETHARALHSIGNQC